MSRRLQRQCARDLGLNVVSGCGQLTERTDHVDEGDGLAYSKEMTDLLSKYFHQVLNHHVTANDHLIGCVGQPKVQFDKIQRLALNVVLFLDHIDENVW